VEKIKKKIPIKPVKNCRKPDDIMSFIKSDKASETRRKKGEHVKIDRNIPSKIPSLTHWKNKDICDWSNTDFLGYYLFAYSNNVGSEDTMFIGRKVTDQMGKERGCIERCFEIFFDDNKQNFKDYIDYILKWWLLPDSFPDGLPSIWSVFSDKGIFIKQYQSSKVLKKKKVLKTRKETDNHFAEKSAWDNYFDNKE